MAAKPEGSSQDASAGTGGQPAPDAPQRESDIGRGGSEGEDSRTVDERWSIWDPPFDMSALYGSNG